MPNKKKAQAKKAAPKPAPAPKREPLSVDEQFDAIIHQCLDDMAMVDTSKESYSDALQQLIDEAGHLKEAVDDEIAGGEEGDEDSDEEDGDGYA